MSQPAKRQGIFYRKGLLRCKMKGYGFSLGGGKGSFGYYPHLKEKGADGSYYPFFPDTQVHNVLRLAVKWFEKSNGRNGEKLAREIFGQEGSFGSRKIFVGDLRLDGPSRKEWSEKRFVVRARTEIEEYMRVNRNNMLAFFEFSYLEGLTMEAPVMIGPFDNIEDIEHVSSVIESALAFVVGFGSSRSRGYGRALCEISWDNIEEVTSEASLSFDHNGNSFQYLMKPLFNIRNKIIYPGTGQLLESIIPIRSDQVYGWFVKAYKDLYGEWPSVEETSTIGFSTFYPLWVGKTSWQKGLRAFPAPMTTVITSETKKIEDRHKRELKKDIAEGETEGFVQEKVKPVPSNYFLTNDTNPKLIEVPKERRIRNTLQEEFSSESGSLTKPEFVSSALFVQELIPNTVAYGGTVYFNGADNGFKERALRVLSLLKPHIGGTLFETKITPEEDETTNETENDFLLVEPLEFTPELTNRFYAYRLGTIRRYNRQLNLPRRQRIVFLPGSIAQENINASAIPWKGFGVSLCPPEKSTGNGKKPDFTTGKKASSELYPTGLSRSQRGILRRMLTMREDVLKELINQLIEKYKKMSDESIPEDKIPKSVFNNILNLLEKGEDKEYRRYIEDILQLNAEKNWEKLRGKIAEKLEKEKKSKNCFPDNG